MAKKNNPLINLERKGYFNPTNPEITLTGCFYIVIVASCFRKITFMVLLRHYNRGCFI